MSNEIILELTEEEHTAVVFHAAIISCRPRELAWVGLDLILNSGETVENQEEIKKSLKRCRDDKPPDWAIKFDDE